MTDVRLPCAKTAREVPHALPARFRWVLAAQPARLALRPLLTLTSAGWTLESQPTAISAPLSKAPRLRLAPLLLRPALTWSHTLVTFGSPAEAV